MSLLRCCAKASQGRYSADQKTPVLSGLLSFGSRDVCD